MDTLYPLIRFIDEPIQVQFDQPPMLEKRPHCPNSFMWGEETFIIVSLLAEWFSHERRGRMGRNMAPAHARRAGLVGSWGVGRFFFRVETEAGQVFDIYYDRAPESAGDRKGHWFLFGERAKPGS